MEEERRVVEFYVLCNKLKDVVRTGWKNWNVKKERLESLSIATEYGFILSLYLLPALLRIKWNDHI